MTSNTPMLGLAAAAAALALVGCGKQGALERPRPLVGHATQPTAEERTRAEAAARARGDTAGVTDPQAPQSVDELRGLGQPGRAPPPNAYAHPVAGGWSGPTGAPATGWA